MSVSVSWSPWAAPLGSSERPRGPHEAQGGAASSALVVRKLRSEWSPSFRDFIASNHTCSPEEGGEGEAAVLCPPASPWQHLCALEEETPGARAPGPVQQEGPRCRCQLAGCKTCCPSLAGCGGVDLCVPRPDPGPGCAHTLVLLEGSRAGAAPGACLHPWRLGASVRGEPG